ncbi:TonB-dependent receptor [Pseudoalteromonas xiamenensis]
MLNNKITKAVRLAIAFGAASTAMVSASAAAQGAEEEKVERIEVTGSAIKRTDLEGSLPVQVIGAADIAKTGVTNVTDLIQQLPAMQGFTTSADSVGGGGGGISTASIHDIGESYTLVLLNGRRIAPATSGGTVNLNVIPVSAIKQVEVLTDGASALYGSDAIAGVVNFILKDNVDVTTFSARYDRPQEDGGSTFTFNVSTGFGDLDRDGFSLTAAFTHEDQEQLKAKQRKFGQTGILSFEHPDFADPLYFFNGSGNAIPGNARIRYQTRNADGELVSTQTTYNPYANKTGACAQDTSAIGAACWFDYTSTIELVPENKLDSVVLNGLFNVADDVTGFATAMYTKTAMTARIAPYPTGFFNLDMSSDLVKNEVLANLPSGMTAEEIASIDRVQAQWRSLPAGNRTTEYETTATHIVAGLRGLTGEIDWEGAFTYSVSDQDQNYPTGWLLLDEFLDVIGTGAVNVFVPNEELDDASRQALAPAIYHGNWENTKITMKGADFKGSMPVFDLPGGLAYVAAGVDYRDYTYENSLSEANQEARLLFLEAGTSYDLQRSQMGIFAELDMPVIDDVTVNIAGRYDDFSGVDAAQVGNYTGEVGEISKGDSDFTYKLSARWQATEDLLLRASYGTGFKAPSLLAIARPQVDFGVTSGNYVCPFSPSDALYQACPDKQGGRVQYGVYQKGNTNLKFETSKQSTVGIVFAPSTGFGITLDYWQVEMEDRVTQLTEDQIFADPVRYRDLFTTRTNAATGDQELAIIQSSANVGSAKYSGVDWSVDLTNDLSFGQLKTRWSGTYTIESTYTRPGTTDDWITSLGRFGDDQEVTFRLTQQISSTLSHGDFAHTVRLNYKSGYQDQFQSADDCAVSLVDAFGDCVSVQLRVPSYTLMDYQTVYNFDDNTTVTFGINNLLDKQPPMSLRTGGAGHQVGFDPRYADVYGRTFYLQADYRF